jgi:hypothetical protein
VILYASVHEKDVCTPQIFRMVHLFPVGPPIAQTAGEGSIGLCRNAVRGCYELTQKRLANAGNEGLAVNRPNRATRIGMRFFSQVHYTL